MAFSKSLVNSPEIRKRIAARKASDFTRPKATSKLRCAGQPLIKLDPRDYEVALKQARASYLQAQAQLLQARAQIPLAEAQLAQAQAQADSSKANCDYLQRTFERDSQLFYQGRGVISRQDLDMAQSQAETSFANNTREIQLGRCNKPTECFKLRFKRTRLSWHTANAFWQSPSCS